MSCSTHKRLARGRLGPGALCALAVAWVFAASPGQARAGCAHYVVSAPGRQAAEALARLDQMLLAGTGSSELVSQSPPADAPSRSRCPGGICSQAPNRLPLAPAPRIAVRVQLWGWLAAQDPVETPSARWLVFEPALRLPPGPISCLERPPRAGGSL
jgi:hypothetical protein